MQAVSNLYTFRKKKKMLFNIIDAVQHWSFVCVCVDLAIFKQTSTENRIQMTSVKVYLSIA